MGAVVSSVVISRGIRTCCIVQLTSCSVSPACSGNSQTSRRNFPYLSKVLCIILSVVTPKKYKSKHGYSSS